MPITMMKPMATITSRAAQFEVRAGYGWYGRPLRRLVIGSPTPFPA